MNEITTNTHNWQPKRWITAILSFLFAPIGMLYLGRKGWAAFYLVLLIIIVIFRFTVLSAYSEDDVWWVFSVLNLIGLVHAFWLASRINEPRQWYSRWYFLIAFTLAFVLPILTYRVFFYELFRIPSDSMAPTLINGDLLSVKKWGCGNYRFIGMDIYKTDRTESCQINRGDVIVFQFPPDPKQDYIKRVVAIGGDDVLFQDDTLYLNNEEVEFEFIDSNDEFSFYEETLDGTVYQTQNSNRDINRPFSYTKLKVPANHYYVLGDNRDNSSDSRVWGLVPEENVIGKLAYVYR